VIIDADAASAITMDMPRAGSALSFNHACTMALSSNCGTFYGSVNLTNCTTISGSFITFECPVAGTFNITSGGCTITTSPYFLSYAASTFHFEDAFINTTASIYGAFATSTMDFLTHNVDATFFRWDGTNGIWNFGTGTIHFVGAGQAAACDYMTSISAASATFSMEDVVNGNTSYIKPLDYATTTIGNVVYYCVGGANTNTLRIAQVSNYTLTMNKIEMNPASPGIKTLTFETTSSAVHTVNAQEGGFKNLTNRLTINSNNSGTAAKVYNAGGVAKCDWLNIKDIAFTGLWDIGDFSVVQTKVTGCRVPAKGMWFGG
jgi:hypothetical protein